MDTLLNLEDNLLLFFTGFSRSAGGILADQKARTERADADMLANLHEVKELGVRSKRALEIGDTALFGAIMHEQWEQKKRRSGGMSNLKIDEWYDLGRANGAIGGKLVGAGGGGFLMFYAEDHRRLRRRWPRPVWRKCGSVSTSKARRCCSRESSGCGARWRSRDASSAAHRASAKAAD